MQKGRSMIEMLGVLAIIGVLSVGGIAGFTKAMDAYKTNEICEQISTIITNVKNMALRQGGSYRGLTQKAAIKMNLIPSELIDSSGEKLKHSYGGEVKVGSSKSLYKKSSEKDFIVEYDSLSRDNCIQILSKGFGASKTTIIAAGSSSIMKTAFTLDTWIQKFNLLKTGECRKLSLAKASMCYDTEMSIDYINNGCNCGKAKTCSIAIWLH